MRGIVPALMLSALVAGCASQGADGGRLLKSAPYQTVKSNIDSYSTSRYGPWATATQRCGVLAPAKVRIVSRPSHGTVRIEVRNGRWSFGSDNGEYIKCDGVPMRGPHVIYQPHAGFVGEDRFVFQVDFVNGERRVLEPRITVR